MKILKNQRALLSSLSIPVMFIAGKQDKRIPFDKVLEQIAVPKHAEAVLLDNVAHMGYLEAPDIVFNALRDFAARNCKADQQP